MVHKHLILSTSSLAKELGWQLEHQGKKIVFAESCTAGLAAAILAQIPGISRWLCGSAVTYQESLKEHWLNIDAQLIRKHTAVSPQVTEKMAESVLKRSQSADFSIAITGHLERTASQDDPHAFVSVGFRKDEQVLCMPPVRYVLNERSRVDRQWEAARAALNVAVEHLHFPPHGRPNAVDWAKVCTEPTNYRWQHWF